MYSWFQVYKQNADLRATNIRVTTENAQLTTENAWLLNYALEGDELLTVARGQRDRLNLQCDTLTREAAQALAEVYRLLLEATQARDDYRAKYEALQKKLNKMPSLPEEEPQYTVVPAAERAKRNTNRKENAE